MDNASTHTIKIGKTEYVVEIKKIEVAKLLFYPKNPRVYNVLNSNKDTDPEQDEIYNYLKSLDHIKSLRQNIESNGSIVYPIIVCRNVVYEGNSRLAAYKMLCEKKPVEFGEILCEVLPDDVSEDAIFTLLAALHINSRKDWGSFEKGGYLYRRQQQSSKPIEMIAEEVGIASSEAKKLVSVYTTMVKNEDTEENKWSYYDELYKIKNIVTKVSETHPEFGVEEKILSSIKDDAIQMAQDIRKVGALLKSTDKEAVSLLNEALDGNITLDGALEQVAETDSAERIATQINRTRTLILKKDFKSQYEQSEKVQFELKKLLNAIRKYIKE